MNVIGRHVRLSMRPRWLLVTAIVTLLAGSVTPVAAAIGERDSEEAKEAFEAQKARFEAEKSKPDFERRDTILGFGAIESSEVVPFLVGLLETESNPFIHAQIVEALGQQGSVQAVQAIVKIGVPLLAGDENKRPSLLKALAGPLDDRAEEWLLRSGLSPSIRKDPAALRVLIGAIAGLRDSTRFRLLLRELRSTRDPEVQKLILAEIRDHKPTVASREILGLVKSPEPEVQVAALEALHALGATKGSAVRMYRALLRSPDWKVRLLALDLLRLAGVQNVTSTLLALLAEDPDDRVKIAAIAGLVETGDRGVIEPLIRAVDTTEKRVKDDVIDALIRLTGVNMGYSSAQWESWWSQFKDRADVRKRSQKEFGEAKLSGMQEADDRTAVYHGIRVLSDRVAFIIDSSESMEEKYEIKDVSSSGKTSRGQRGKTSVRNPSESSAEGESSRLRAKIEVAKSELHKVLKGLKDGVLVNIIRFDTLVTPWSQTLTELDGESRPNAATFVNAAEPNGLTNLYNAIDLAFKDERMDTIFLLSDGAPTTGKYFDDLARLLAEVSHLNRYRRVKINTIGFNLKPDEQRLMEELADANYGVFIPR